MAVRTADPGKPTGAEDAALDARPDEALEVAAEPAMGALVAVGVDGRPALDGEATACPNSERAGPAA